MTPDTADDRRSSGIGRERWVFLAVALLTASTCVILDPFAQEAYYWMYAQHPDLSYFDHPPMVAWMISAGTRLFGNGAMGIRAATWLAACATTWLGLLLLREFGIARGGRTAWIAGSLAVPALAITHILANPDVPLTCFWMLSLLLLWRARSGAMGWWLGAGVAAGCALLSKYTGVFLAASGLLILLFDPRMRRQLRRPGPYVAVVTAALVFLPVLIWNLDHDFASFRFQTENRLSNARFGTRWLLQCVGGQILMINPVIVLFLPVMLLWLGKRAWRGDERALWVLAFGVPLPAYLLVNSMWMQMKINWFTPAYAVLLLGGVLWWRESGWLDVRPRRRAAARVATWVIAGFVLVAPLIRTIPRLREFPWSGWPELATRAAHWEEVLDAEDSIAGNVFFFATNYKASAQIALHLRDHADGRGEPAAALEPVMAQNVLGQMALQFDYWESPAVHVGQDAILILEQPERRLERINIVRQHFHSVELVERVRLTYLGMSSLDADLFVCRGYRGPR